MTQSLIHIPPVNQYKLEREFYDFIQLPENRGFNAHFAEELKHKDDSGVSRMHNPNVPDVKSWLYKAADKLDRACRVNLSVGKKALAILAGVVARHEGRDDTAVSINSFDATYFDLKATLARHEDGLATEAEVEAAKARHAEATARVGAGCRTAGMREQQV